MMKGIMYLKSLYLTLSAEIHNPGPMLARKAIRIKNGREKKCQLGGYWYQSMSPKRITKEIKKSTNDTTTAATGMMSRGKYTLLIKLVLLNSLSCMSILSYQNVLSCGFESTPTYTKKCDQNVASFRGSADGIRTRDLQNENLLS